MSFVGSNKPVINGEKVQTGKVNYFIGRAESQWRTNIPTYAEVVYEDLYPDIDLRYIAAPENRLKYQFEVKEGSSPARIRVRLSGVEGLSVDKDGNLIIKTAEGEITELKPYSYQEIEGRKVEVGSAFLIFSDKEFGFQTEEYGKRYSLIIDPGLVYSVSLGGNSRGYGIAVDDYGSAYVAGWAGSTGFPITTGVYQTAYGGGGWDAFVSKVSPDGSDLVYSTFLGGDSDDFGYGIAIDNSGNCYVTGQTYSADFPTTPGAYQTAAGGSWDGFVTKLSADGSTLLYSTFLGGAESDDCYGIALDAFGNAHVTGFANSSGDGFPTTAGAYQTAYGGGDRDAFVTKLRKDGSGIIYSTYLGGSGGDHSVDIAVDAWGNTLVTGDTWSTNFPVTAKAYQPTYGGSNSDAFVSKLSADGTSLLYSTYLGGSGHDRGYGVTVDNSGNAYVTGWAGSADFPITAGAYQTSYGGNSSDVFVSKLSADGSDLVYSTFLGASGSDRGDGIDVDDSGNAYITGQGGIDFPTTTGGGTGAFLSSLNTDGSRLIYSTFLSAGIGRHIIVDTSRNAYVTGDISAAKFNFSADITVTPSRLNFGNVDVGSSLDQTITVVNDGTADLVISTLTAPPPPFSIIADNCSGQTFAPSESGQVTARFSPTSYGAFNSSFDIPSNDPDENSVTVNLVGIGGVPDITVSPITVDFGDVLLRSSSDQLVTVSNDGTADLVIDTLSNPSSPFSIQADDCSGQTLGVGDSRQLTVRFSPISTGVLNSSFDIPSNDPDENPFTVNLTGRGVAPDITVSPATVNFGNVLIGTSSDQLVTISNDGTAQLTIGALSDPSSPFSIQNDNCSDQTIAPGDSCQVTLRFSPTSTGPFSSSFDIPSSDPDENPVTVNLTGIGVVPDITVNPVTVNFGSVAVGDSSDQFVTVSNDGTGDLVIGVLSTPSSPFSIPNDNCSGKTVGVGYSCQVTVRFAPTSIGVFNSSFDVPSNDPGESPVTVNLIGKGIVPDITVNPTMVNFGNVLVGDSSDQSITIANDGEADLLLGTISDPSLPFSMVRNPSGQTLAPWTSGQHTHVIIRFTPSSTGVFRSSFNIPSDDPDENPVTVSLIGKGVLPDITVSPTTVNFGDVLAGNSSDQSVTVTNDGTADLVIGALTDPSSPFSIVADNCSGQTRIPLGSCQVTVRFLPASTGAFSSSFDIPSNDPDENPVTVNLVGMGVLPDITVDPMTLDFGNVMLGAVSDQFVTVTNDGTANLVIGVLSNPASPFGIAAGNCSGQTLAPTNSCQMTIRFAPTSTGAFNSGFDIPSNDPDENPITVRLTGTGVAPDITVDLIAINFGDVEAGSSSDQTITVTNDGTADLLIGALTNPSSPFSIIADNCSGQTLAVGDFCQLTVRFSPISTGVLNSSFDIPSNDPDENPVTVNLIGTGVVPDITVSPATVNFGNVLIGTSSDQLVTISNDGTADLAVGVLSNPSSPFSIQADNCSGQTLAPGNSCQVTVRFSPTLADPFVSSFDIPSSDPDENPVTVNLTGTAVVPDINVNPVTVNFANVLVGNSSHQFVTISSDGTADLVIGVLSTPSSPFTIPNQDCSGKTLGVGDSCQVTVRFSPTSTGVFNSSFDIPSNDPDENPITVNLFGKGVVPDITVNPTMVNFGNVLVGDSSDQSITIANDGEADLLLGTISDPSLPFTMVRNPSGQTLAPWTSGQHTHVIIRFTPSSTGVFRSSFNIPSDDPDENPVTVSLIGKGVLPDITVSPTTVNFGDVLVGNSSDQSVTVTNDGTADLVIGAFTDPSSPFSIVADNCSGQTRIPLGSCQVTVRFSPASTDAFSSSFDIPSNDPDENPVTVNLVGMGVLPDITVDPMTLDFGNVMLGAVSDQFVTVTNDGTANLVIGVLSNPASPFGIAAGNCSGQTLAPTNSCQMTIRFAPTSTGAFNSGFDIPSNDPDENPITVRLTGTGVAPDITVDLIAINFGDVEAGSSSDQTITVTNHGTADLLIGALTNPPSPFSIIADNCSGQTFTPLDSGQVTLRFSPTLAGAFNSSFDIPSNDPDENPVTITLTGNGKWIPMQALSVLKANISQNNKTAGQKAKISGNFQIGSDKDVNQGIVITIGEYTEELANLTEKKETSWQYKRPKDQPKQGIKKLKIKWDKKGNVDRDAVKMYIAIDNAPIFPDGIPEGSPINVDVLIRHGLEQGGVTIGMTQKKQGKLRYKARK